MDAAELLLACAKFTVVDVRWEDSQLTSDWRKVGRKDRLVAGCRTVGMLESVTEEAVVIILSWDKSNKHANGILSIPMAAIKKAKVLN